MREKIIKAIQSLLNGEQTAQDFNEILTEIVGPGHDQVDEIVATYDIYPYRDLMVTRKAVSKQIKRFLSDEIGLYELKEGWVDFITLLDPGFEEGYEEILLDAIYTLDNFEDFKDSKESLRAILAVIED
ncbi:MAG TPA: hypothetical protein VE439_06650 [Anaerolineae bacterium]|nr:hypothetical protein [Anaerolineae bacterium]